MGNSASLKLDLNKTYSKDFSLDISTELPLNGVNAIFGHSGSGKTTLLRCIAGLEKANGALNVNGQIWQDENIFVPPYKRPIGYVFQDSKLFPHLNVLDNLNYAVKRSRPTKNSFNLTQVINLLGIAHLQKQLPSHLSGGERQRVAIARALAIQPELLLMDEPLASLDEPRKNEIIPYLQDLQKTLSIPIIYVTHSVSELAKLADHVVMLNKGEICSQGEVSEVFSNLATIKYLGKDSGVVIKGKTSQKDPQWNLVSVSFEGTQIWVHNQAFEKNKEIRIRVLAKDVSISLSPSQDSSIQNRIPATIERIERDKDQAMSLVKLRVGSSYIVSRITRKSEYDLNLKKDLKVWAQIKSVAILD